jgi:hypothetical protein
MRDRRAVFFALFAAACFVLVPLAAERFRNLTTAVGVVYVVLALASYLDFRGRQ